MEKIRTIILPRVLAFVLWIITLLLGLIDIYLSREIFYAIYARFSTWAAAAIFLGNSLVVILAVVYLGFAVMTGEYHARNVGKSESWSLFTKTLVVELAIPFLAYFM